MSQYRDNLIKAQKSLEKAIKMRREANSTYSMSFWNKAIGFWAASVARWQEHIQKERLRNV